MQCSSLNLEALATREGLETAKIYLEGKIKDVETRLEARITQIETRLKEEMAALRQELRGETASLRQELTRYGEALSWLKWLMGFMVAGILTMLFRLFGVI
jgi:hypothetical protein